mgnify:CR=1 FL=1
MKISLEIINIIILDIKWWKAKVPNISVKSIKEPTPNAEDVARPPSTNRRNNVQPVDSPLPKWGDTMAGPRRQWAGRDKGLAEWGTWGIYLGGLRMGSRQAPRLRSRWWLSDHRYSYIIINIYIYNYTIFTFYSSLSIDLLHSSPYYYLY